MTEAAVSFQSLPTEYQRAITRAEQQLGIAITPLQQLSGGWSGAVLYLVRVVRPDEVAPEHLILKLDRVRPKASSDEISRHRTVQEKSPPGFAAAHLPGLALDRVESDGALAVFYSIAGQSLRTFRTLSSFRRQSRLEQLFTAVNDLLLDEWNAAMRFETIGHPQELLTRWLGFRLDPGRPIETFLHDVARLPVDTSGFLVRGRLLPNPLLYAREAEAWGQIRPLDAAVGLQHGDLNTNNILAKFSRQGDRLDGCYLIDFALFKPNMPLLYDQRYLEMSYLIHSLATSSLPAALDLISGFGEAGVLAADQAPIEMTGVNAVVNAGRRSFEAWVENNHPSLHDDLWAQYWLAGAAAGLAYCHKVPLADEVRLVGLTYAAANMKQVFRLFDLPLPSEAIELTVESPAEGTIPAAARRPARSHLPAPMTPLIGRSAQLADVDRLLRDPETRLVTLTGPGGTGKTRLALEAGRGAENAFPDGVHFIDLAGLSEAAQVVPTAAHTLGIREGGGLPPLDKLKEYLADRRALLIFDNFEQVVGAAPAIGELLTAAPGMTALITSRVPLQLRGESEYPVPPLTTPPSPDQSVERIAGYESVALFQQAARSVQPNFEITADNQQAVVEICRRLDGLPLAIEIAAARVKMLPPKALLARLDQRLPFLVSPAVDLPARQKTLRGAIDWSYQLLDEDERELFVRLGIFAGGFVLAAAGAVCPSMDEDAVYAGVEALLNNSLLRQAPSATDEPRFDMLQTIREFAAEKADELGMTEELEQLHCLYFSELADGGMDAGIYGPDSVLWMKIYEQEHDNYRQAMAWALAHPDQGVGPLLAMMTQLSWFWYRQGYLQEGSAWMQRAVEATEGMGDSPARAFALSGRGSLALWSGDLILAANCTKEAMDMGERLGLDLVISLCNMTYGTTLINQGKDRDAYPYLVNSVELYDEHGQTWLKGTAMVHLANVSLGMGDPAQALQWLDTAKPLLNATGDVWTMAFGLSNYGEVARAQGDYEVAEEYYLKTRALYQQADSKGDQARLLTIFGYLSQHKGETEQARSLFLDSLAEFRKLGNQRGMAESLAGLAGLAAEQGAYEWAAPLLGAAQAQLADVDGAWWPADRVEIERTVERLRSGLSDGFEARRDRGESMGMDAAIEYAQAGW